jgi:homoserine O-acetyltransferase/O-succinyltransferase
MKSIYRRSIVISLAVAVAIAALAIQPHHSSAQEAVYPGAIWQHVADAGRAGWSAAALKSAREYAQTIPTAAVMIVSGGQVVDEWGDTATRYNVHSIRKSFLSAMYGIHVREGRIDLSRTLEQLGIDDNEPSLTATEKQAILHDVLKARSGVYHPALYETAGMKARRPARGSHAPGTFWYYNNWDFNVLGTVFERLTKTNLFVEFKNRIADPIGMEDYRIEDGTYVTGPDSVYPAYPFRMTARDMARFGLLFLHNGDWRGRQVVPADWVKESSTSYSDTGQAGGYGYLWWVAANGRHLPGVTLPEGTYSARGAGGHFILVIPAYDTVIVHRVNTDVPGRQVTDEQFGRLVKLILDARSPARPSTDAAPQPAAAPTPVEGDFAINDFRFESGETLPRLNLHYRTLGTPERDASGVVRNAALILHGTGGTGAGFLNQTFGGELFQPGQLLDARRYFIVLPDGIGHGKSSKPSDGTRMRFPKYTYDDMVRAQHTLLTDGLKVNHLRLVLGTSMGAMHCWVWGEMYPDFVDGLVPLASAPTAIAGRNRVMRKMIMDSITRDPAWKNGDYSEEPRQGLAGAINILMMMTSSPLQWHRLGPTRDAADKWYEDQIKARLANTDANDMLYHYNASREYDPSANLDRITAAVLAINSADDVVNPPELGLMEKLMPRVKRGRYVLIPTSDRTRGHGTHSLPAVWGNYLAEFLNSLTPNTSQ